MYRVKNTKILLQEYAEPKIYRCEHGAYAYPPVPDLELHLARPTPRVRDQRLRHVRIVDVPKSGCLSGIRPTLLPNLRLVRVLPSPVAHISGEIFAPDATIVHFYDSELEAFRVPPDAPGRVKRAVFNILYDPVLGMWPHRGWCMPWALRGAHQLYVVLTPRQDPAPHASAIEWVGTIPHRRSTRILDVLVTLMIMQWYGWRADTAPKLVFVGAETWSAHWLSLGGDGYPAPLTEAFCRSLELAMFENGIAGWAPERFIDEISFMSMAEFRTEIGDDELMPYIMAINPDV
jgi:hypothetical protein